MKKIFYMMILLFTSMGMISSAHALDPQDWIKKLGQQRTRKKSKQRQTMVAAVRGVEEPGEVDPEARNFEAVQKMEKRNIPPAKVLQFREEGKLKGTEKQ